MAVALKEGLVVAGTVLARNDAKDRVSEVAVDLTGLEAPHGLGTDRLMTTHGAEHTDHGGAHLGSELALTGNGVPAESSELRLEEIAHLSERGSPSARGRGRA